MHRMSVYCLINDIAYHYSVFVSLYVMDTVFSTEFIYYVSFQSNDNCGILLLFGSLNFHVMQVLVFQRDHENFPGTFSCACMNYCSHKCGGFISFSPQESTREERFFISRS
jgi:hypothetical protein